MSAAAARGRLVPKDLFGAVGGGGGQDAGEGSGGGQADGGEYAPVDKEHGEGRARQGEGGEAQDGAGNAEQTGAAELALRPFPIGGDDVDVDGVEGDLLAGAEGKFGRARM